MRRYKYDDWDFNNELGNFDERIYIDNNGNKITGILEGFYGYTSNKSDDMNRQYVEKGVRIKC